MTSQSHVNTQPAPQVQPKPSMPKTSDKMHRYDNAFVSRDMLSGFGYAKPAGSMVSHPTYENIGLVYDAYSIGESDPVPRQ